MAARYLKGRGEEILVQPRDDEQRAARGGTASTGANGATSGTNGGRPNVPMLAYVGAALFILLFMTVNVLSLQHDAGAKASVLKPIITEYSAGAMLLALMPLVAFVSMRTPFEQGRWLRFAGVHFLSSLAFCLVTVGGFVLLRKLIFASLGQEYRFGPLGELIYEYRKIMLVYFGLAVLFYLTARLSVLAPGPPMAASLRAEATFDIRNGLKLIRVLVDEIVSVRSAGNYVEFHLADGRRPLMRVTLSTVEAALKPHGFLRTHRSWLVNPICLRALEPEGSGDFRVLLNNGGEAPLSRRFPLALDALRGS